jgi:hypothetical protein
MVYGKLFPAFGAANRDGGERRRLFQDILALWKKKRDCFTPFFLRGAQLKAKQSANVFPLVARNEVTKQPSHSKKRDPETSSG